MVRRKAETFEPVTMGHIRGHGCRDLLVYCNSGRCHHSATMNADWLPDETLVRSLCRRMVCTRCGMIGADVRPDWSPHVNKRASEGPRAALRNEGAHPLMTRRSALSGASSSPQPHHEYYATDNSNTGRPIASHQIKA
jgi:hypothetical protein